ncbi:uncharacterized protein G2W53_020301 [Senna tora]|uniref:Uncharacterized protein n=1 Tax=Senna tora TaxID=362788 RepID=A0A834TXP0_9FABA|nr:uncharacterized protein G2W53_020301 [Senna tora]
MMLRLTGGGDSGTGLSSGPNVDVFKSHSSAFTLLLDSPFLDGLPCSSRKERTSSLVARSKGVFPAFVLALRLAPFFTKYLTSSRWDPWAA